MKDKIKSEVLSAAIIMATNAHAGQFDRGGFPYIMHPMKVAAMLKTDDLELMAIAILHDIVEDCGITWEDLRGIGMTDRVIEGIRCMTKIPGETYDEYKAKVKSNPDSIKVKKCDLRHNTDLRRLKGVTAKDMARVEKYLNFYVELNSLEG